MLTITPLTGTWIQLTTYPECEYFDIEILHKDRGPVTELKYWFGAIDLFLFILSNVFNALFDH